MKSNWQKIKLGEILTLQSGYAFSSKKFSQEDGIPLIRIRDIKNGLTTQVNYIGAYESKYLVNKGDLLIGMDGEFRCYEWKGEQSLLNQRVCKLKDFKGIHPKFLLYGINKYLKEIEDVTTFTTVKHISAKKIKNIQFPLPSEIVQKQLVSKLDQAFEAIDQAIANTEKNIENVDELFQSQLDFLFSSKDDSWSTNSLSEIATLKYGYTEKSADTGHYRYIRITDIDKQGKLRTETKQYLAYSLEAEKYLLKHNDLLMARTGATHGKVLLYDNIEPSIYASYLIRIDFNIPIDNEVYWFFSKSKSYWKQASQLSSGSAQPQFNGNALKKVSFSYPRHKDDQDNLKEKCRAIFESTENLKQQYTAKLNELESLKMNILEKAFKGELI